MHTYIHASIDASTHPYIHITHTYTHIHTRTFIHSFSHSVIQSSSHSVIQSFMHSCIHAFMHSCIHAFMHSCIHAFMHSCNLAIMHSCIHAFMHSCIHAFMHLCIHAAMHSCIHAFIHFCIHAFMHACMQSYRCILIISFVRKRKVIGSSWVDIARAPCRHTKTTRCSTMPGRSVWGGRKKINAGRNFPGIAINAFKNKWTIILRPWLLRLRFKSAIVPFLIYIYILFFRWIIIYI